MRGRAKLNDTQRHEICRRYLQGETPPELAREFGVAPQSVRTLLKKRGIKIRPSALAHSPELITAVLARYADGESPSSLGREYGILPENISRLVKTHGGAIIRQPHRKVQEVFTEEEINSICDAYSKGETAASLAKKYEISADTVRALVKKSGIHVRSRRECSLITRARKYTVNHSFFHEINTEEKAYWLGFIAADGCTYKTRLQIALAAKDEEHLCRLGKSLGSSYPVHQSVQNGHHKATICINSTQIVEDLVRLGLGSAKTFTHPWPHEFSDEMKRHFLRGYLDGDGTFYRREDRNSIYFSIVSHLAFLHDAQQFLMRTCDLGLTKISPHERTEGIGRIFYSGNRQVAKIARLLYKDATIYLPRKRVIVEDLLTYDFSKFTSWRLSADEKEQVRAGILSGESHASLARQFGVSTGAILGYARRMNA